MIVCHCGVVSDSEIAGAVEAGARSLAEVCSTTGAGRGCGVCVLSVKRQLCRDRPSTSDLPPEVEYAAS